MQSEYQVQCCVVENLRNLSRMLMCLDRVGKELFLEVSDRHVSLRTLNQAQSAFVTFTLKETFFSDFIVEDDVTASVKLHLKNMVSVFRSVQHVDKLWLQLACQGTEQYMRVQHECSNGMRKKFDLALEEVEPMNAVYSKAGCPHRVCADPMTMLSCLSNFPAGLAEVALVAMPDALILKNDVDQVGMTDKVGLRTEMRVNAADLYRYHLGQTRAEGLCVSFSLREFRAILQLMKEIEHRCAIFLEGPGQPVIFNSEPRTDLPTAFVFECALATVIETTSLDDDMEGLFDDAPPAFDADPAQAAAGGGAGVAPGACAPPNPQHGAGGTGAPSFQGASACSCADPQGAGVPSAGGSYAAPVNGAGGGHFWGQASSAAPPQGAQNQHGLGESYAPPQACSYYPPPGSPMGFDASDTEEDEDAVPGTPPGDAGPPSSKRQMTGR